MVWICHLTSTHPPLGDLEDTPFIMTVGNKIVKGAPVYLRGYHEHLYL